MADTLLTVTDLEIKAGDTTIVDRVSFELERGRVLGLIGESGAGKSTIGLAALGYSRDGLRLTGGRVTLNGRDILNLSANAIRDVRAATITYVAQSAAAAFNPAHRLMDQVIEATLWHKLMGRRAAIARAKELFALLGLPDPERFGERYPHQVSGGQLQRAMTAMALCSHPDLIVFDEPTTALDVTTQIEVLAAIKQAIASTGTAALYISHDLAVVSQIADEIVVLRHGRMVERGTVDQIFHAPRESYTRDLVSIRQHEKPEQVNAAPPLLAIDGIKAGYSKGVPVLHGINLVLGAGQTLAVVGESGSGKSTLARVVTGLLPASNGSLIFDGQTLQPDFADRTSATLRDIQIINQIPDLALNPRQTIAAILGRPLTHYFGLRGAALKRRVTELLDQIELPHTLLHRYPAELSGGQKQRICIARALAAQPKLIICDEPTSALDPLVAEGILDLLMRLQKEFGTSYLFITHDLAIVRNIADTVAVMLEGRVVRHGPKAQVLYPPFDPYTEKLIASVPQMRPNWLDDAIAERDALRGKTVKQGQTP
ncbi:ABC transporter ATP-binding protein [Rhizobium sp. CFBP 8762]|uniref:ABC transporter ATP-binding protein n=1 Tax=Rhizobium sp. CFBP 8762 TaxID=2775279 RepID=UPI00177BCA99|nr:ABC transporter ATP-binding protein [Rhizobium sp. CFBP 8762]MBD8555937.1 ABC transporter ATP-binding protein [Rhizobium sp. CFBP 8762]